MPLVYLIAAAAYLFGMGFTLDQQQGSPKPPDPVQPPKHDIHPAPPAKAGPKHDAVDWITSALWPAYWAVVALLIPFAMGERTSARLRARRAPSELAEGSVDDPLEDQIAALEGKGTP